MSSADPFISSQDLSDWIGRDVTADAGATMAIDAACDIVRTFADQTFNQATDTVTLDGTGTDCLLLHELPVTAAGTVVENGTTLTLNTDYVLAKDGRLLRTGGTAFTTVSLYTGSAWPAGRQNVKVTYDHGYSVSPSNNVPRDVRLVALAVAQRLIVQGPAMTESVGGQSIGWAGPASNLTAGEQMVLGKHRPRG